MAQIDDDFPAELRVQHKDIQGLGTVQANFPGTGIHYEPWEIPVIWDDDGHKNIHGVNHEMLIRVT